MGQLYSEFEASIWGTTNAKPGVPDFDHAVGQHRFIDAIRQSSDDGRRIAVALVPSPCSFVIGMRNRIDLETSPGEVVSEYECKEV